MKKISEKTEMVLSAVRLFRDENNKFPTQREIAARTGLSQQVVSKIYKDLELDGYLPTLRRKFMHAAESLLESLEKRGKEGDVQAIKLFFQLLGWSEKITHKEEKNIEIKIIREDKAQVPRMAEAKEVKFEQLGSGQPILLPELSAHPIPENETGQESV